MTPTYWDSAIISFVRLPHSPEHFEHLERAARFAAFSHCFCSSREFGLATWNGIQRQLCPSGLQALIETRDLLPHTTSHKMFHFFPMILESRFRKFGCHHFIIYEVKFKSLKIVKLKEAPSSKAQIAFDPLLSYFPTAGATSQQGVISELTFFNLGYTLDKLEIFNFSLIALIASKRLIQDCQLKYRLITYGELSRRHWYSGSLVGDSLLPFKPSNPLPIQLVRGCSIYKVIRSYVLAEEEMCNQRNLSLQVLTCVSVYFG